MCCSIDATYSDGFARMCNDEYKKPNAVTKRILHENRVALCLFALKEIHIGEEVRYDYGPDDGTMFWRDPAKYVPPQVEDCQSLYAPDELRQPVVPQQQHDNVVEKLYANVKSSAFLKFEDRFSQYHPGYVEYSAMCSIDFSGDISSGIFSGGHRVKQPSNNAVFFCEKVTRSKYCECCKVAYASLSKHVSSFQHRMFRLTESNYASLDSVICARNTGLAFDNFLLPSADSCSLPTHTDAAMPISNICSNDASTFVAV